MPFSDNYTNFWFNDINSETMKVWVTNERELQFQATPTFNDTFVTPVAGQTRYHTNTTMSQSDLSVKCIAIGVNLLEWRSIQNWLNPLAKGKLSFSFNDNTYYMVKVSKAIQGGVFVEGSGNFNNDIYNITFTVDFTTIADWAALGPQVTVPIRDRFKELDILQIPLKFGINELIKDLMNKLAVLTINYNETVDAGEDLYDAAWWIENLDPANNNTADIIAALNDEDKKPYMIDALISSLSNLDIVTLSSAINNKYYMPEIYNVTKSKNTVIPSYGDVKPEGSNEELQNRVYITEPTMICNKTIYLDENFYDVMKNTVNYSSYNYYFVDSNIYAKEYGDTIDYTAMNAEYVAYIREGTFINTDTNEEEKHLLLCHKTVNDDYDIGLDTQITRQGISFYGVPVLFTASSESAYNVSPFYYIADKNTYSIMNAGSYDSYPDLYVNLGGYSDTIIKKEQELIYQYKLSIKNGALEFDGKTGFVLFNNELAEGATLTAGDGSTKVVTKSINNGMLNIPSGHPELMRVRIFGKTESKFKAPGVADAEAASVGITHLFFQPVGEFRFPRNNSFAALLFESVDGEQKYNTGTYPFINRSFLESSTYGSRIRNYSFTTNGFVTKTKVSKTVDMWVLTLPTSDFTSKITVSDESAPYMYLSLCDTTELSIYTDDAASSYFMMQTRDAY